MTPRESAEAARKLLDRIQHDYSKLNIYEFHKRREDVIEAAITEHVRALLADDEAGDLLRARQLFHYQRLTETFYDRLAKGFADYRAALRRKALGESPPSAERP